MGKRNVIRLIVPAVIVGAAIFLVVYRHRPRLPEAGDSAPDFTVPGLSGEPIRLRDFRRRVVVLNFWATWCPPCIEETPSLKKFADQMRDLDVVVLGVSVDEDADALKEFVAKFQLSFPLARDPDQAVASRYGTYKFPETFLVDQNGRIAEKFIGAVNWQDPRIVNLVQDLARSSRASAP